MADNNKFRPKGKNYRTCICNDCTSETTHRYETPTEWANMYKVSSFKTEGYYFFVCPTCATEIKPYSFNNRNTRGEAKKHGFTFGIEYEAIVSLIDSLPLYEYGWEPTSDMSIRPYGGIEWKSPLFYGLSAIPKLLESIDSKLIATGKMEVSDQCGTHCHIGNVNYAGRGFYNFLKLFHRQVFEKFYKTIVGNFENDADFWGRELSYFCGESQDWRSYMSHNNFITIRENRIEFRQSKFKSARQYMNILSFGRECQENMYKLYDEYYGHMDDSNLASNMATTLNQTYCKWLVKSRG